MGEFWVVNSLTSLAAFIKHATALFKEHGYVTFTWRIGKDRSLDQNALLHVWCTEYAAHLLTRHKKEVSEGELEGMKRIAKKNAYGEHGWDWLIHEVVNPFNPEQKKKDYTSSRKWKKGEMFLFLTWLQAKAADDGLVLESKGEYAKLQRENG